MFQKYDLRSRKGIEDFDRDLTACAFIMGAGLGQISLLKAYDRYFESNRKAFYTILDLKLCLLNLLLTMRELERRRDRRDIADTFGFNSAWFNFVTTYRAFYDKFMNLIVSVFHPDKLASFEKARSKKKKFIKLLLSESTMYSESGEMFIHIPETFTQWLDEFIQKIDNQYRTGEVHGSGMARKWVFSEEDLSKTPYKELADFIEQIHYFFDFISIISSGEDPPNMTNPEKSE